MAIALIMMSASILTTPTRNSISNCGGRSDDPIHRDQMVSYGVDEAIRCGACQS
jgi:hypothetical protein